MSEYAEVLKTQELGPGQSREIHVQGHPVLVFNIGQIYHALDARCPDSGTPLELRRRREGDRLVCPTDGAEWSVDSGERQDGDGPPLRRYRVRIEENTLEVGPALA